MLFSGAGLVGLVVFNLWRDLRDADARNALDARLGAEATALDLKAALRDPDLLDLASPETCFELRDGALLVPPGIGWLEEPPARDPQRDLDPITWQKLDAARRLEFTAAEPAAAAAIYEQILAEAVLTDDARHWITAAAAWQAHRAGNPERRDQLQDALHEADGGSLAAATSATLLRAAAGQPLPPWSRRLCLLPPERAEAVLLRLEDHGVDTGSLRAELSRTLARRQVLRRIAPEVDSLLRAPGATARALGDHLLLYFPAGRSGRGALLPPANLIAVLQQRQRDGLLDPPIRWSGEVAYGDPPPDAVPAVSGLLSIRPTPAAASPFSQPWVLGALMLLLAGLLGLGTLLSFRSLRREALAMRARTQFLTTVTHELKTPLAGIRLLAEMLEEGRVRAEGKQREYFSLLSGEAARLTMLIENVLDLGRMERSERSYDLRPQAIDTVVRECAELFRPVAGRDGMELALDLSPPSSAARVDRGAFVQALLNVMDNARKYAAAGGRLEVEGRNDGSTYAITIRDRGPGIDQHERQRIFERFERGSRHLDGSIPGVGLGLYLARTILRRHGGELTCEDSTGGACFTFTIPLAGEDP